MSDQALAQPQAKKRSTGGTLLFGRYYMSDRTRYILRQLFTRPTSLVGMLLLVFFIAIAVAAPVLAPPHNPARPFDIPHEGYSSEPHLPSPAHIFGTTEGQYDIYYGVIWGTRTAFLVGLIVTGSALLLGVTVGAIAGYYGGWIDDVLMRIVEVVLAFPFLLAAITLAAVLLGAKSIDISLGDWHIVQLTLNGIWVGLIALAAFAWPTYSRLIRAEILTLKNRDFVTAARAIGANDAQILIRHILPNAIFPTLVYASLDIGSYVVSFAALSFLGLGAEEGYADWGQMISHARNWIPSLSKYPHIVLYPGLAILLFVMSWNLIGDAFRDIIDPRLAGSR
jgi:peptide/nickel transport system permease protein